MRPCPVVWKGFVRKKIERKNVERKNIELIKQNKKINGEKVLIIKI